MGMDIIRKPRRHKQISPIILREIDCFPELSQFALTQFESRKANSIETSRRVVCAKWQVVPTFVSKQSRGCLALFPSEQEGYAETDFSGERCLHGASSSGCFLVFERSGTDRA
jgi:hypothetical protein